jgi:hypothetical protein
MLYAVFALLVVPSPCASRPYSWHSLPPPTTTVAVAVAVAISVAVSVSVAVVVVVIALRPLPPFS